MRVKVRENRVICDICNKDINHREFPWDRSYVHLKTKKLDKEAFAYDYDICLSCFKWLTRDVSLEIKRRESCEVNNNG